MVKRNKKGALQDKGVRQLKKFHLEDEPRNLHQDVHQDKPILPKQVTKGILEITMFHQMIKVLISLVPVWPQTSMILQVTPEALPKFNMWAQLIESLVPIQPKTYTILQVTPEALPKFHMWTQ